MTSPTHEDDDSPGVASADDASPVTESTPDLDAIAASFDEIEGALRRLDEGTYFGSDTGSGDQPDTAAGEQSAV